MSNDDEKQVNWSKDETSLLLCYIPLKKSPSKENLDSAVCNNAQCYTYAAFVQSITLTPQFG